MPTTLKTAITKYLRAGNPARGTRNEYYTTLKKWNEWGEGVPIEKLGRKQVREFLDWVYERAVAQEGTNPGRTANKAREHLRAIISWAWEQNLIDSLPRFPKPKPQRDVAGRHYLTKAEINDLYFATHKMKRPRGWNQASQRLTPCARIGVISYTNVAVREILNGLASLADRADVSTIHSFLFRNLVRPYLHLLKSDDGEELVAHHRVDTHSEHFVARNHLDTWLGENNKRQLLITARKNSLDLLKSRLRMLAVRTDATGNPFFAPVKTEARNAQILDLLNGKLPSAFGGAPRCKKKRKVQVKRGGRPKRVILRKKCPVTEVSKKSGILTRLTYVEFVTQTTPSCCCSPSKCHSDSQ